MSRYYEMYVEIDGYNPNLRAEIEDAASQEWTFDDWSALKGPLDKSDRIPTLTAGGRSNLCGGESEDEFAHRLTVAIFRANKGRCKVRVTATYLENLPCETYEFDEEIEDGEFMPKTFRVHYKDNHDGIEGVKELTAMSEDDARDIFSETTPADEILDVEEA
jgi:hypothetical protein